MLFKISLLWTLKLMLLLIIHTWKILRKDYGWPGPMYPALLWIFLSFLFPWIILSCFFAQYNSFQNSILIMLYFKNPVKSPLNPASLVWHQGSLQSNHYFPIQTYFMFHCLTTHTLNQVQMGQLLTTLYKVDFAPNDTDFTHPSSPGAFQTIFIDVCFEPDSVLKKPAVQ